MDSCALTLCAVSAMDVSITHIQLQDTRNIHVDRHVRGFSYPRLAAARKKWKTKEIKDS